MHTGGNISRSYARAFAVRDRMRAFQADQGAQGGWHLATDIFVRRFDVAFGFFLDAPTADRLARLVAFEVEIAQFAVRIADAARQRLRGRQPRG